MPNGQEGDPVKWIKEQRKIMAFYDKISVVLQEFADTHGITIYKYDHNGPRWTLLFKHPEGGLGQIAIDKSGDENVNIYSLWSVRNYEKRRKGIKTGESKRISLDHKELREVLEICYKIIRSWRLEDIEQPGRLFSLNKKRAQEKYEQVVQRQIEGAKLSSSRWDNWDPEKLLEKYGDGSKNPKS